jgi:GR25 family glycosyltransferase involved in LPS biosynthesis
LQADAPLYLCWRTTSSRCTRASLREEVSEVSTSPGEPPGNQMRAYVINLVRSPERRSFITAQLEKTAMPYEVVEAVDGRDLDVCAPDLVDPALATKTVHLSTTVACALSHIRAYRKVLQDRHEVALVLEDDVTLPTDLARLNRRRRRPHERSRSRLAQLLQHRTVPT